MKDTSLVTEVRIKLHIKFSDEPEVKNLWMCLNYDQKPTIAHVVNHVKKNLLDEKYLKNSECKLYLDNFWLPPYESSHLIRENDFLKVEVNYLDVTKESEKDMTIEKLATLQKNVLNHIKATEQRFNEKQTQMEKLEQGRVSKGLSAEEIATVEAATRAASTTSVAYPSYTNQYNHYYDAQAYYGKPEDKNMMTYHNYWMNNDYYMNQMAERYSNQEENNKQKSVKATKQASVVKNIDNEKTGSKMNQNNSAQKQTKSPKEASNCYHKFAIGSYAHLLNEPVQASQEKNKNKNKTLKKQNEVQDSDNLSEEQIIDKYYNAVQKNKSVNQKTNENSAEFDKIAANVNSAGRQKWKNSTQPAKSNGPKHIIFRSSDELTSESSSESESEYSAKKSTVPRNKVTSSPSKKITLESTVNKTKKLYEPSKDEQLDAVSYNRSYFIKNTKNVIEFKKTFNEEKLNAPQCEEFADRSEYPKSKKDQNKETMNTSTSSTDSQNSTPEKSKNRERKQKSLSPEKFDYEKLQSLVGAPRINDKIAFQILEISSNFTPEVSAFKTGKVIEFDQNTNEITLEMNNNYNQVLKRANKFSVIIEQTDQENLDEDDASENSRRSSQEADNILKVDWRNLMNVKLIPDEQQMAKQDQFNTEITDQMKMNLHV